MLGVRLKVFVGRPWAFYRRGTMQYNTSIYSDYMDLTGSEIIIRKLQENNVRHVFGYPGGNCLRLIDELHQSKAQPGKEIHYITNSCEISSGFAAKGYSRASGKTAVVMTTSGPSVTYLMPSLMDAYLDGVPVLAITGQVPSSSPPEAFQECPVIDITKSFTKWSYKVTDISHLPCILDTAFSETKNGRPGPVVIDCPSDIYGQVLSENVTKPAIHQEEETSVLSFPQNYMSNKRTMFAGSFNSIFQSGSFLRPSIKIFDSERFPTHAPFSISSAASYSDGLVSIAPHENGLPQSALSYNPIEKKTHLSSGNFTAFEHIFYTLDKYFTRTGNRCTIATNDKFHRLINFWEIAFATQKFHLVSSNGLQTRGAPLGLAIGAQLARPNSTVICLDEPTSFSLTSTELRTLVHYNIPIKVMLLDSSSSPENYSVLSALYNRVHLEQNGSQGTNSHSCTGQKDAIFPRCFKIQTATIDYELLAKSYNINFLKCKGVDDLDSCVEEFVDHGESVILRVEIQ